MIDIVLASKNQIKFVEDTISGLKKQTYQNYNLICIDGYSDDGTDEVIKNFKKTSLHATKKVNLLIRRYLLWRLKICCL